jgi:hypothetical protein
MFFEHHFLELFYKLPVPLNDLLLNQKQCHDNLAIASLDCFLSIELPHQTFFAVYNNLVISL